MTVLDIEFNLPDEILPRLDDIAGRGSRRLNFFTQTSPRPNRAKTTNICVNDSCSTKVAPFRDQSTPKLRRLDLAVASGGTYHQVIA
jgi:hypothetical protein